MADSRYKVMLLFGPPGAGKGTQGRILASIPGLYHLATGDMFRSLDPASPLGKRVTGYSSKGELVPDDLTIELWQQHLRDKIESNVFRPDHDLLILDGIPRSAAQAEAMDLYLDVLAILHIRPPSIEDMVQRLKRRAMLEGRRDDADEAVIRRRFQVYEEETAPVLGHYPKGIIREVSAVGAPIQVLQRILEILVPTCLEKFRNPLSG